MYTIRDACYLREVVNPNPEQPISRAEDCTSSLLDG